MARPKTPGRRDWLFPNAAVIDQTEDDGSLLDVLDNVLNKGVVLAGDVVLGVADVDLVYVKLSALLAAFDKIANDPVVKPAARGPRKRRRRAKRRR